MQGSTALVLSGGGAHGAYQVGVLRGLLEAKLISPDRSTNGESLDQYNDFDAVEQHWHHLMAAEAEVWF